jgi:hypothetical protein
VFQCFGFCFRKRLAIDESVASVSDGQVPGG